MMLSIHNQYEYFFAFILTTLTMWRLSTYLKFYFTNLTSNLITLLIVFHPLSIDALLIPNVISGNLAFLLFIESLFMFKQKSNQFGYILLILASICNVNYCLLPIYFLAKSLKDLKRYYPFLIIYLIVTASFLFYHSLKTWQNPIAFLSQFILFLAAPIKTTFIKFSIFPMTVELILVGYLILVALFWIQKNKQVNFSFFSLIFLPLIGVFFNPWNGKYAFENEVLFNSSSYLIITFSFFVLLGFYFNKKTLALLTVFTLALSLVKAANYFPLTNFLDQSFINYPFMKNKHDEHYVYLKRVEAKINFEEQRVENAKNILLYLNQEYPKDEAIKEDLKSISKY